MSGIIKLIDVNSPQGLSPGLQVSFWHSLCDSQALREMSEKTDRGSYKHGHLLQCHLQTEDCSDNVATHGVSNLPTQNLDITALHCDFTTNVCILQVEGQYINVRISFVQFVVVQAPCPTLMNSVDSGL